ncbi:MAG: hypothetical protein QOJ79_3396 [Actinomycetota bacterium]|jgi:hypothetical protein|nr:hypothetical protein [Actinomycetota bacterium]
MDAPLASAGPAAHATTERFTALASLPAGDARTAALAEALEPLLLARQLPGWIAPRWLAAATDVLATPGDLELFVQHDPVLETVTIELWCDGSRLFETDVWIG